MGDPVSQTLVCQSEVGESAHSAPVEKSRLGLIPPQMIDDVLNTLRFGQVKKCF